MKKFSIILLAIAFLCGVASLGHAEPVYTRSGNSVIKISTASAHIGTLNPDISAGDKIIGFTLSDPSAGTGVLWDESSVTQTATNIIGEGEVAAGGTATVILPLPYQLVNGLVTAMDNSTAAMAIYYE